MPLQTNIQLTSGDDRILDITVTNDAGTAIPLTNVSEIEWNLRTSDDATTNLIEKTYTNSGGITITDIDDGIYSVELVPEDTVGLDGIYYWESVITDTADGVFTAAFGYASVRGKGVRRGSYCTLEEAMALMASMDITERTQPSLATAQIIVETIARDIDGVLMGKGYALPVTDENALSYLKSINQYGACAAIIRSRKLTARGVGGDDGSAQYFEEKYREALSQLKSDEFNLLSGDDSITSNLTWGGSSLDSYVYTEDATNNPFWKRGNYF